MNPSLPTSNGHDEQVAQIIEDEVGEFLDLDVEENGSAVGCYLRAKVRIDILQPMRRRIIVEIEGDEVEQQWASGVRLSMSFSRSFVTLCGIIGLAPVTSTRSCLWHEKQGGWLGPILYGEFSERINDCGLVDLGYKGDTFTWHNNSHRRDKYIRRG